MGFRMTSADIVPALLLNCQPTLSDIQMDEDVEGHRSSISWDFNGTLML